MTSADDRRGAGAGRTTPARALEVETKLELDDHSALPELTGRALRSAGIRSVSGPVVHELDAVYYDTAQLDLLSARLTLRRRTGGDDAGWHLKLPAAAGARTEVTLPLSASASVTAGHEAVPAELADLVAGAARGRPLQPVARVRNHRTVVQLLDEQARKAVEIADDRVEATDPDAPSRAPGAAAAGGPLRWRELEAELKDGTADQLTAAVQVLRDGGARPASSTSKLARALGQGGTPGTSDRKGGGSGRKADRSAANAVASALTRLRDAQIVADRLLREDPLGGLHDARSGARRLRSVLEVFGSVLSEQAGPVQDELRTFGRILSAARDLAVMKDRLAAQLVDEPAEYAGPARVRLDREWTRRMPAALAEIDTHLRSEGYFGMLRGLDAVITAPHSGKRAGRAATAELPAMLSAAWRTLQARADRALGSTVAIPPGGTGNGTAAGAAEIDAFAGAEAAHAARRKAKTVRYAAEAVAPVLGEPAVVFAAGVELVQEVLGEHQDALICAALLAELALDGTTDGAAGFAFGRIHAFEQAAAHGAIDDFADAWYRLADAGPFDVIAGT